MVCLPKEEGGLGVLNLKTQNESLLLKNLYKFYNKVDTPWYILFGINIIRMENYVVILKKGFFWWRDNLKLLDKFKGLAMCKI